MNKLLAALIAGLFAVSVTAFAGEASSGASVKAEKPLLVAAKKGKKGHKKA